MGGRGKVPAIGGNAIMIESWAVILSALVYLCLLFYVAHWGDGGGRRLMRRRARGTIYALALAVYCTSWTFYGSVGLASRAGLDFLTIYLGPILVIGLGHPLLARIIRIARAQNTTSIADFIAARYGKSERVAALVSVIALAGALPYVALQLKAVSSSVAVFLAHNGNGAPNGWVFGDIAFPVALVLAAFALAFGTRHADATEHQNGLVLGIAVESLVKLTAFLGVGLFVTFAVFDGPGEMMARVLHPAPGRPALGPTSDLGTFATMTVLAACAALLLPRQFHMAVVENRAIDDVKRAAWLFPLYLVAINLFVIPLALAGLDAFPDGAIDRDMTVLALPLKAGSGLVALITFVGGLSAATAMVIVETIAVAIMVSNHLVTPLILRVRGFSPPGGTEPEGASLGGFLLGTRRIAIVAITLLAYAYYRLADDAELASIGLLSFAAVAQIAPAFFGGLFWRRGTALGASAGLTIGILVWAYTLFLPSLSEAEAGWLGVLSHGPFGVAALRPTSLAGLQLPQLTHGALWSLGLNILAYIGLSYARPATALERLQAGFFMRTPGTQIAPSLRFFRATVSVDDLRAAVGRYLGEDRTRRSFAGFARAKGLSLEGRAEADIQLLRYAEHLLASAIGAASSRLALSLVLRRRNLSRRAALKLLDDASAAMQQNRDLLQHALDHAQQGITVLDRELHLLSWNQSFIDLFDFPPELIRIGVGLSEILRLNAERGAYGPGDPDALVAQRLYSMLHESGPVRLRLHNNGRVISVRSNHLPGGGLFATYTDVTEIVAEEEALERENETLEERVRERTEELTRLNAELTAAKRQAEEANASKTRFLAAASHDILQPLNAARLYATSLVERTRDGAEMVLAENVGASLDAVEEILTTLLDISRLDSGVMQPRKGAFRLDDLMRQLALEFEPIARERGLHLRFVATSLWVRTDRRLLRRLLQNLVSNAIKYTPRGRVLVGTRRVGGVVRVEVWDTGLGIPEDMRRAVFVEFRRLSEGARAARGVGLGLSIVERLARVLDLEIHLASQPGRGSVFGVTLPVAAAEPVAAALPAPIRRPNTPLVHLCVLAIDNEPAILDGMRILLSGWGCDVATATSLDEGLDALERPVAGAGRPEVVIADYHLDDGNGLDAITALRAAARTNLPAVLVTADHTPELRQRAEAADVSLLNKPLKPAALRALLAQWRATRIAAE